MLTCQKCGSQFSTKVRIDGAWKNLQSRRHCLECAPPGVRLHRVPAASKLCPCCGDNLPPEAFYQRIKGVRGTNLSSWCRKCFNAEATARQRSFKLRCIQYKGGSCSKCGYAKCPGALEFHHRDPGGKDFCLSKSRSHAWTQGVQAELDKCDLLCANCHREAHEIT